MKMSRKVFPKAFLIGCDKETNWMISWFLKNYFKHKNETKFVFADFELQGERMKKVRKKIIHLFLVSWKWKTNKKSLGS